MKLNYSTIIKATVPVLALLVMATSSCRKSFLETVPKGKLIAETVNDYDLLLNNNDFLNTGGAYAQVFLGDEVAVAEPYFSSSELRDQRLFKWEPTIFEPEENAPETESLLRQLYAYNKIINEVMGASGGTTQQKNAIRAEALAGRAWVNFVLINYFGKPYNAATAASDAGFPIITEADVTETKFDRASVKEVYELIVNDLVTAIPDLPSQLSYRLRMSKVAGEALLGKVYMYMARFEEALPLLNDALNDITASKIPVHLIDYAEAFSPTGEFMPISIFGPNTPVIDENPETIYARQFSNFWILSSALVLSPATISLFGTTDFRLNFYSDAPFPAGPSYQAGLMRRTGPLTTGYGVELPDLILLRAECRARLDDLSGAVEDLVSLRKKRMPELDAAVPPTVSNDKQSLLEFVFDERIREYASQGVRWFDMRRLSVDPLLNAGSFKHAIFNEDGSKQEITLPEARLVLKIPPKILLENPGMNDNL